MLLFLMMLFGMAYNIIYDASSLLKKDLQYLHKHPKDAHKIKTTLEIFSTNPLWFFGDIKKLSPKENNISRIRIWNYRIIFSLDSGNQIIVIHRIGLRKDVYR